MALLGSVAGMFFFQDLTRSFFYHRVTLSPLEIEALGDLPGWQVDRFEVAPGVTLAGLIRPAPSPNTPWLLFFHGNGAAGVRGAQAFLETVRGDRDWGLAAWSYRGFGASGGKPTQAALFDDARALAGRLRETYGVTSPRLFPVGFSLGSGVAVHLAAALAEEGAPPAGLVLVASYTSLARVVGDRHPRLPMRWFIPDPYPTERFLGGVRSPVLVMHGSADGAIPLRHAREVAGALGARAKLVVLEGRGHADALDDPETLGEIRRFVEAHAPPAGD